MSSYIIKHLKQWFLVYFVIFGGIGLGLVSTRDLLKPNRIKSTESVCLQTNTNIINTNTVYLLAILAPIQYKTLEHLQPIADTIDEYVYQNVELIAAIISAESNFELEVVSYKGARGLMQVMPFWRKNCGLSSTESLYELRNNIMCGTLIINEYIGRFGNIERAVFAYKNGPVNLLPGTDVYKDSYVVRVMRDLRILEKLRK